MGDLSPFLILMDSLHAHCQPGVCVTKIYWQVSQLYLGLTRVSWCHEGGLLSAEAVQLQICPFHTNSNT